MENKNPKTTKELAPLDTRKLAKMTQNELIKVASAYVPEDQASKRGYIGLIADKYMIIDERNQGSMQDLINFLYTSARTGLDPMANQIHAVFRWDSKLGRYRMTIQTGIDGLRLVAQRSGLYGGQDDAIFEVEELFNPITGKEEKQLKAIVTVYRINPKNGERMAVTATARWNEYVQTFKSGISTMWQKFPHLMLAKCAEALALRKAFPQELSGLYINEEMEQADEKDDRKSKIESLPVPTSKQKPQNAPEATEDSKTPKDTKEDKNDGKSTKKEEIQANKVEVDKKESENKLNELLKANKGGAK